MSKLKACPFCGDVEDLQINDDSDKEGTMYVWCYACNVSGPSAVMPKDVWNHRPLEDALKAHAVEVLVKELEIKKTYEAYFGYVFPEAVIRFKKGIPEFDKETRAEARALLGWEE